MQVNSCVCCGSRLLRHAGRKGIYWFCTSCHQEMIPLSSVSSSTYLDIPKVRSPILSNSQKHYSLMS